MLQSRLQLAVEVLRKQQKLLKRKYHLSKWGTESLKFLRGDPYAGGPSSPRKGPPLEKWSSFGPMLTDGTSVFAIFCVFKVVKKDLRCRGGRRATEQTSTRASEPASKPANRRTSKRANKNTSERAHEHTSPLDTSRLCALTQRLEYACLGNHWKT